MIEAPLCNSLYLFLSFLCHPYILSTSFVEFLLCLVLNAAKKSQASHDPFMHDTYVTKQRRSIAKQKQLVEYFIPMYVCTVLLCPWEKETI